MNRDFLHITQEEWALIDRYLMNTMPNEDLFLFKQTMDTDAGFQKKVNYIKDFQLGIKEAVLQNEMDQFHHKLIEGNKNSDQKSWLINLKKYTLVAAIIGTVIVIGWLLFMQTQKQDKVFTAFYKPDPGLITAMSTQQDYIFDKGMVAYKIGNYKESLQLWHSLEPERINSDTLQYFLGNAYLAQQENTKALDYLKKVSEKRESSFYNDANWYLGLVYIKRNDFANAYKYISLSTREEKQQLLNLISTMQSKAE